VSPTRTALLLGATGLVGGRCLERLLAEPAYSRVVVLGRRPVGRSDPKLEEHRVDFDRLAESRERFRVDDVFCCLGTTIRRAGSREAFRRVDLVYPRESARLAAAAGAEQFLLVTAVGADPASSIFYNRVKGEVEEAVRTLGPPRVVILRPSLLLGERGDTRPAERLMELGSRIVGPLLPKRYRAVEARAVAAAMVRLALDGGTGVRVVESEEIPELAA
jgi:uncharacterized protein YbjT (DUF2867 family)